MVADSQPQNRERQSAPRRAGALFLRESTMGWGRRELAIWLMCHYGRCVIPREETASMEGTLRSPNVDESTIIELVCVARAHVLRVLWQLGDPTQAEHLSRTMLARGLVSSERDERRAIAYRPVDLPRARLADRVASLFVADYLNASFDYQSLHVCPECGVIGWSGALTHDRMCSGSRPAPRRSGTSLVWPAIDADGPPTVRSDLTPATPAPSLIPPSIMRCG